MDEPPAKKVPKMVAPPPPNLSLSGLNICKKCNLVFFTDSGLERHYTTRNHRFVCEGLKPNFGDFFCFLCWDGFLTKEELRSHYLRETHEKRALEYSVKSTWMISGESSQKSCVKSDITILKCPNCQLEFISNDHLTYHFKSYSHKEVISGQYLPKKLQLLCMFERV